MHCLNALLGIGYFLGILMSSDAARAQDRPTRSEIWDLKLGAMVAALPDAFTDYACGTNGGPPSMGLSGWQDYRRCRPDAEGLREVYFRYDDELEYWAKANNFATEIKKYSGTKLFDFPVVLSARFDDAGRMVGIRIVSDPRDTTRDREEVLSTAQLPFGALSPGGLGLRRSSAGRRRDAGVPDIHQAALPKDRRWSGCRPVYRLLSQEGSKRG